MILKNIAYCTKLEHDSIEKMLRNYEENSILIQKRIRVCVFVTISRKK